MFLKVSVRLGDNEGFYLQLITGVYFRSTGGMTGSVGIVKTKGSGISSTAFLT